MKKFIFILLIFISSCSTDTPVSVIITPDTSPMWRQFGFDSRHSGNPNSPKVPLPPVMNGIVEWCDTVTNNYPNDGSECAIDSKGNIYFLSTGSYEVIKYNSSGQKIWKRDTLHIDAFCGVAISTDESQIFYGDYDSFNCRDSSGNLLWRLSLGSFYGTPIIDRDNNIYVDNGLLTKISKDGNVIWTLKDIDGIATSPAFDRDFNIYYAGIKNDHNVLVKADKLGSILWLYDFNNYFPSNMSRGVVIDGYNNIYYSADKLYCINKNGRLIWQNSFGGNSTPAITQDNKLIIKSYSGFTMIDTSGTIIWTKSMSINSNESAIVLDDEDNIYYNYWGSSFSIVSLNKSGNVRWNMQNFTSGLVVPGPALSPLARLITYPKRPSRVYSIK